MNLITWTAMLAEAPSGTPPSNPVADRIKMIGFPLVLMVMFYMVLFRPQQQRTKQLNDLLKGLKPGDKVVTSSGIIGTIVSVKDKTVALRSAETKLEVLKSTISEITERSGAESGES